MWRYDIQPEYHVYDELMISRFHVRERIIAQKNRLIRQGIALYEEGMQSLQDDQAEDERLTRLALSPDKKAFENAMNVKKAQIAVQDAEEVLQKAKAAADKAVRRENAHTTRVQEQSRKKAESLACLKRMLDPEFPSEMLLAILEAAVRLGRLQWHATEPGSQKAVVDEIFAWPSALEPDMRAQLQRAAGRALLKKAIIELPADFTSSNSTTDLVMPLAIMATEQHIRHLVLEIKLNPRSPACQAQLNKACRGIAPLSLRIPKPEVFVVSLFFEKHEGEYLDKSFNPKKLMLRNQTGWKTTDSEDLKTTLLKFLNVLRVKGPGRHKLVRFIDRHGIEYAHAGPLVKVPEFVTPQTRNGPSEFDTSEGPTVAEQVLEQAYRYHRDIATRRAKELDKTPLFYSDARLTEADLEHMTEAELEHRERIRYGEL